MLLKSLCLENFLSFSELKIDFSKGLFLVDGYNSDNQTANGAGKSTIFDAIVYALYGKTPRECRLDDFVKIGSNQKLKVVCDFLKNDVEYSVERTRNPDTLILRIDGQIFSDYVDNSELNSKIASVLGISYHTFISSVYFPQNRMYNFLSHGDEGKKTILTELIGLQVFDKIGEVVKEDFKKTESEGVVARQEYRLVNKQIETAKEDIRNYDRVILQKQKDKEQEKLYITKKIEISNKSIIDNSAKIQSLSNQSSKIPEYQEKIKALEEKKTKVENIKSKIFGLQHDIESYKREIKNSQSEKENLMEFLRKKICHTCGQKIYETDRLNDSIKAIDGKIESINKEMTEAFQKKRNCTEICDKHRPKIDADYKSANDLFQQALSSKRIVSDFEARDKELKSDIQHLEIQLQNLDKKYEETAKFKEGKQKFLLEQEKELKKIEESIETSDNQVKILEHLKSIFGKEGIKAAVFVQIVSELNSFVQKYLSQLFEDQISLKFLLQTEMKSKKQVVDKFDVELLINDKKMEYNLLSGGEKKRLILAVDFALAEIVSNRSSHNFEFMILDEVFDSLDAISKTKVMDFLENLRHKKKQMFVIDHSGSFKNSFDDVIFIEKKQGVSCLKL